MNVANILAAAGVLVTLLVAVIAATRWLVERSVKQSLTVQDLQQKLAREQQIRDRTDAKVKQLEQVVRRGAPTTADQLKLTIDDELFDIMTEVSATESSILVPEPIEGADHLIFLSCHTLAEKNPMFTRVPFTDTRAGEVYVDGKPQITVLPRPSLVDRKSGHTTTNMLTVPLHSHGRRIGVAQFLNKENDETFTDGDKLLVVERVRSVAARVAEFIEDRRNFDDAGLFSVAKHTECTVMLCDLSNSTEVFDRLRSDLAIRCIDEYMQRQCDIAIRYGGIIEAYIGDGVMFRFLKASEAAGHPATDYALRAVKAALEMQDDFADLKQSWLEVEGYPLNNIFNRIGIAAGPVWEGLIGHSSRQDRGIFGQVINRAANICNSASRGRNVVLTDGAIHDKLDEHVPIVKAGPETTTPKRGTMIAPIYELRLDTVARQSGRLMSI